MKGIVFSFRNSQPHRRHIKISFDDIRCFFRRNGISVAGCVLLLFGMAFGAVYARNATENFLNSLDFLFSTNLEARLSQGGVGTFCACFASDFIFLAVVFLLGISPWGNAFLPFVLFFKGFGTGITAGYLFLLYSVKGIGFYLLILLPGTFLFCVALILFSSKAFDFSKNIFCSLVDKNPRKIPFRRELLDFCTYFLSFLIMSFLSALVDAAMWMLFAGAFGF